ncbi:Inactive tyrosine-protein kinase 7 [Holothuria leucospilota]|uniref:Inactive tyrosine-protein kinase 7 n=1 Tax=Holothuria leucospilota TaxID=206669 RepID=A0A9Q1HGU7_HOLLE|nr:Inactive tyrosine-protein kinase 7 [Holothuria leucospilota]
MRLSPWLTTFIGLSIFGVGLDALSFTTQPLSQDVTQGRQITLQCAVDDKLASFDWRLDGNSISDVPGVSIQDGNLVISSVDRNDHEGSFTCVARSSSNQNEVIVSEPATLNILWIRATAVLSLRSPSDVSLIQEGIRVSMTCKADGNPTPILTFFRDSTELSPGGNVEISGNRLRLQSVTTADNGVYSCKAENRGGIAWTERGNITINIRGSNYPTIVVEPDDQMVLVGGDAFFHCQFSGTPTPPVEWYKYVGEENEGLLINVSGTVIFPNGTLVLENIKTVDQGTYKCLCKSPYGEPSVSAELRVSRVEPLPEMDPITVAEGSEQRIRCAYPAGELGGIPTPTLQWTKAGSTLSADNSQRVHVVNGSLLVFDSIEKSDEGNYTCTASNSAGEVHSYLYITVATKPRFTVSPVDTEVRESDPAQLDCQAEADPEPTIRWQYKGAEMSQNQFTRILDNGTLVFYNPSVQNAGTYTCVASNIAINSEASALLTVKAILRFNPKPVGSTQFELGALEKINCRATAATTPTITWMKDSKENPPWDDHVIIDNGMIMFNGSKRSDAGNYMCIARTEDEEINATIKVEVYIKPKFTVTPQNTSVMVGHSVLVNCEAYGDPEPVITWIKVEGDLRETILSSNNSLYIVEVQEKDAGKYTCYAGSKGGLNTTDFYLTVERGSPVSMSPELMTRTFAIAVGCALAYILLFIFLMIWCKQRRRKRRMTLKEDGSKEEGPLANGLGEYHDEEAPKGDITMTAAAVQGTRANYDKLQFPRHDLETIAVIGHGAYGEVSIARAQGIRDGEDATTVLVKALETKDENLQLNFRGEIDMLNKLNHENIVKLLGICKEGEPQLMITEYLDWGDLKQFLKATRGENGSTNAPPPLTYNQKVDVISQVALGMEHLSNNRFVHADLAARNCLLSPSMEVKICTMSASKDLYRNEYHEYQQRLMPVRWMPVEAIFEDELSTKSDVWSFGVFVWEVFSQGDQPYSEWDNDAYMSAIVDGNLTLKTPSETPKEVEVLMQGCWASSPKERPSFSDIVIAVQQLNSDSTL